MRWKALQFLGKLEWNRKQTFGFKSPKYPPAIDDFELFESDLQRKISNIEFRPIRNKFLSKLSKDIKNIKNNIRKTYKKSNRNWVNDINLDAKKSAHKIENRSISNKKRS